MRTLERLKNLPNFKPCPICGSEPKLHTNTYDPWGDGGGDITEYWYECDGCGIIKGGRFNTYSNSAADVQKEASEDWNEVVDYLKTKIKEEK